MIGTVLFLLTLSTSFSHCYKINKSDAKERKPRIASGVIAKVGENLDYALLTIVFQNQMQTCGGVLIEPRYVLTTASCVYDVKEGVASVVNVTFPQMKFSMTHKRVYIHDEYNFMTYANNIAIIKLTNAVIPDGKVLMYAKLSKNNKVDEFVDQQVRACGFGSVANYLTYPSTMMCTNLFVQPSEICSSIPKTICTFWSDRDNNLCTSDYGGPIYTYKYVGTTVLQWVIGLASHSPDYRRSAPCYDGHKVVHVQVGAYESWIKNSLDKISVNDPKL